MDKEFYHYLYNRSRVSEMIADYCKPMLKVADPLRRLRSRKLLNYWNIFKSETFLFGDDDHDGIPDLLQKITDAIDTNFPDLDYDLSGRIKDLFSTLNKVDIVEDAALDQVRTEFVENYIKSLRTESDVVAEHSRTMLYQELDAEGNNHVKEEFAEFFVTYNFAKHNPFDRIRDFLAFRIIIEDEGKGDKIVELYEMANMIIELINSETTFDVVPSMPLSETGPLKSRSHLIFVPSESGLKKEFIPLGKDYIVKPKPDGYQSLHIVLQDPFTNQYVELQLRTRSMHIIAETDAKHEKHKEKKYGHKQKEVAQTINFSQIHLANNHFRYYKYIDSVTGKEEEHIHDKAGITKPFVFDLHNIDKLKKFVAKW